MSSNTHYPPVRIQDSTRFTVDDSIVVMMEPQISLNLTCAGGFSDVFRWKLDAKIVDK